MVYWLPPCTQLPIVMMPTKAIHVNNDFLIVLLLMVNNPQIYKFHKTMKPLFSLFKANVLNRRYKFSEKLNFGYSKKEA